MLTAGAIALAVIAPALDPAEQSAEAVTSTEPAPDRPAGLLQPGPHPEAGLHPGFSLHPGLSETGARGSGARESAPESIFQERQATAQRANRSMQRRAAGQRPATTRPVAAPIASRPVAVRFRVRPAATGPETARATETDRVAETARAAETDRVAETERSIGRVVRSADRRVARDLRDIRTWRRAEERSEGRGSPESDARQPERQLERQPVRQPRRVQVAQRRVSAAGRSDRRTTVRPLSSQRGRNMGAVIEYARSQLGRRYVNGGEGLDGFDCSGLTKRAYAQAGMSLPHSSGAQAAKTRSIPRSQAEPGDLVVGSGHVGIYMGKGMMIDAGNHRTGVVYRKIYRGLRVARIQE
ncbi:NlpC/P60 family protein [Actinoplanes sp. NPDC051851]|uniref:C40 family peptidase n=1 Tax=Actinoplanes sp. NPDC051851 TaxID=3154753 RepID=UPI00341B9055